MRTSRLALGGLTDLLSQRLSKGKRRQRSRRRKLSKQNIGFRCAPLLSFESLEERLVLAADDVISVGRSLSSWTTADIVNNELKITYSVFNQQAETINGLGLATTLQPGVQFVSSSISVQQNGQTLSWDLGALAAFGWASVEVVVVFPGAIPLQLDGGASASGILDSTAVNDAANPILLRSGAIDPNLLSSTLDANVEDPFIQATAAMYDQDPAQIFQFLTQDIGYESYTGSLRGSRGTLWSEAGNSLDEASLGVALLRASGIPARYAHGTLSDPLAQELILSMFPEPQRIVGRILPGTTVSDPVNDLQLLAETRDHYWMQYDAGSGFVNADSTFRDALIGETFAIAETTFAEVSDNLRHKVTIRLDAELTNTATGLFGLPGQSLTNVLTHTFATAELVGKPVNIGHFVNANVVSAPAFSASYYTYSPYLVVGDDDLRLSNGEVIRGQDYLETLTNFPFGSVIATGLFLEIDIVDPSGSVETLNRTIADRIGSAVRENGGPIEVNLGSGTATLVNEVDLTTISISSSRTSSTSLERLNAQVASLRQELLDVGAEYAPDRLDVQAQLAILGLDSLAAFARSRLAEYEFQSDAFTADFATLALVKAYLDSPRVSIFSGTLRQGAAGEAALEFGIDLRKDDLRAIAYPGQNVDIKIAFELNRGASNNALELLVLGTPPATSDGQVNTTINTATILQAAEAQGISVVAFDGSQLAEIDTLLISQQAKNRMREALSAGKIVVTPTIAVEIDGIAQIGWYEIDTTTGRSIGVLEDGTHGALSEFGAVLTQPIYTINRSEFGWGVMVGLIGNNLVNYALFILGVVFAEQYKGDPAIPWKSTINTFRQVLEDAKLLLRARPAFLAGYALGITLNWNLSTDPPLDGAFISPRALPHFDSLPTVPPVATAIVLDPLFTLPFHGAELPMYRIGIRNNQAFDDTFSLDVLQAPPGYTISTSVPRITIPAGEVAEVGVILEPTGSIPPAGTNAPFAIKVTSITNPGVTSDTEFPFIVPIVHGLDLIANPPEIAVFPGTTFDIDLAFQSFGNSNEQVNLSVVLSDGLSVVGVMSLEVLKGQSFSHTIELTVDSSIPLNTTLTATLIADFGLPIPLRVPIQIRTAVPGADAIANAATAAGQIGLPELAGRLNDLSIALTDLFQQPDNPVFRDQALNNLDSIITQMTINPDLADFVGPMTAARTQLEAATTPTEIRDAIESLGTALNDFAMVITAIGRHDVTVQLNPTSRVAVPLTPQTFDVVLHNVGSQTTTYNLSVAGLPLDVDSQFSQSTVTLASNEFRTITVTLTQASATNLAAFGFTIDVSFTDGVTISRSAYGSVSPRNEHVSIVDVTVNPPFGDPGDSVAITTRLLNSVNQEQEALVTYRVLDSNGVEVVPFSVPKPVTLTVVSSLAHVDLDTLDTTGLALGQYTIEVTVTDTLGNPIPGAIGTGTLLIGSPVSANIDSSPVSLPPGTTTITNTLDIGSTVPLVDPLSLVGAAPAPGSTNAIRYGDYVYVASPSGIWLFDVAGPNLNNPVQLDIFGFNAFTMQIHGDMLVAVRGAGNSSRLDLYSLANPAAPVHLGTTGEIPYGSASSIVVTDTHVFIVNINLIFFLGSNDIFDHNGSVIAINIEDPTAPYFDGDAIANRGTPAGRDGIDDGVLFNENGTNNDGVKSTFGVDQSGGNQNTWDVKQVSPTILLVTGSSVTGGNTQDGVGLVRVIDISDPRNIRLLRDLEIPGTVHAFGIAIDGDMALVTATQGGFSDFTPNFPFSGQIVLATLDISDPANPQLIHTQVQPELASGITFDTSLGGGLFAYGSNGSDGSTPTLHIVNASNPNQLVVTGIETPARPTPISAGGNLVLVTDGNSLLIYDILGTPGVPVTAEVQIPKTGVTVVPNSFSIPPSNVIVGTDFDTYVFNLALGSQSQSRTITWESVVTQLQPGERREVTLTSSVHFTSSGSPGEILLPPQSVYAEQILGITPATQTVQPGEVVEYMLSISNPSSLPVTYDLSVLGVPQEWVTLDFQVTVLAGTSVALPVLLKSNPFALVGDYGIVVNATKDGVSGSVQAMLTLAGLPVLSPAALEARGVFLELTPLQATAGQGTSATYILRVTNTGSQTDTFDLATSGLPLQFGVSFQQTTITVPPGVNNFRDVLVTITPPVGTVPGNYSFSLTAISTTDGTITDDVEAALDVLGLGVDIAFVPPSGGPESVFQLMVTNTGQFTETFELSVAGPAALAAMLSVTQVTLNPGQSQLIPVQIGEVNFAFPGSLQLVGFARSVTDPSVMDAAAANVTISAFTGFNAYFDPSVVILPAPASITLPLFVENLGNMEQSYSASIIATTGTVTASFIGVDDLSTQTIPTFILPGLTQGILEITADVTGFGISTIIVGIFNENGELLTEVTATINVPDPNAQGSISGLSYVDSNNNGVYAAPEHRILGAEILLLQNGNVIARTYSNINGEFHFPNLAAGTYTIQKVQPTLYFDGIDTPGSLGDLDSIENQFTIILPAAANATGYAFAERGLLPWYIGKSMYLASTPTNVWQNLDLRVTPLWYAFNPEDVQLEVLVSAVGLATVEVFDAQMMHVAPKEGSNSNVLRYQVSTNELHYLRLSGSSPDADMSLAFTGLAGDFDGDGDVDGRDFLLWQRGFGRQPNATSGNGDADANGVVDSTDLHLWQENYSQSASSPALAAVMSAISDEQLSAETIALVTDEAFANLRDGFDEYSVLASTLAKQPLSLGEQVRRHVVSDNHQAYLLDSRARLANEMKFDDLNSSPRSLSPLLRTAFSDKWSWEFPLRANEVHFGNVTGFLNESLKDRVAALDSIFGRCPR